VGAGREVGSSREMEKQRHNVVGEVMVRGKRELGKVRGEGGGGGGEEMRIARRTAVKVAVVMASGCRRGRRLVGSKAEHGRVCLTGAACASSARLSMPCQLRHPRDREFLHHVHDRDMAEGHVARSSIAWRACHGAGRVLPALRHRRPSYPRQPQRCGTLPSATRCCRPRGSRGKLLLL